VTRLERPWGHLQFGPYFQLGAAGGADLPEEMRAENISVDRRGPYLALGRDHRLVTAQGLAETGGRVAYGRVLALPGPRRLALGAQLRGFGLMRTTRHELWARAVVRGMDDVRRPEEFDYRFGFGFGLDTFAALDFDDRWLGTRLGARLEDTASFVMVGDEVDLRTPRLGLGAHVRPLRMLGEPRAILAIDLERVETGAPAFQLGVTFDSNGSLLPYSSELRQSPIGVRPAIGVSVHERDLFDDPIGARITGGIGLSAGIFHLDLSAEYEPARQLFDMGLSIGLGP
jgi:hypothetical protein